MGEGVRLLVSSRRHDIRPSGRPVVLRRGSAEHYSLIAKTVSQPPGIAITDPTKIIRALDVFVLLMSFLLLMAHFIGGGIERWRAYRLRESAHEIRRGQAAGG